MSAVENCSFLMKHLSLTCSAFEYYGENINSESSESAINIHRHEKVSSTVSVWPKISTENEFSNEFRCQMCLCHM